MIFGFFNTITQNATKKFRRSEKFILWCKKRRVEMKEARQTIQMINWVSNLSAPGNCNDRNVIEFDGKIDKILRESLRHYSIRFSNVSNYLEVD